MSIGNWITIGLVVLGGFGTIKIYFNDLKHLTRDVKDIKKHLEKIEDKVDQNEKDISFINGKMNGG